MPDRPYEVILSNSYSVGRRHHAVAYVRAGRLVWELKLVQPLGPLPAEATYRHAVATLSVWDSLRYYWTLVLEDHPLAADVTVDQALDLLIPAGQAVVS